MCEGPRLSNRSPTVKLLNGRSLLQSVVGSELVVLHLVPLLGGNAVDDVPYLVLEGSGMEHVLWPVVIDYDAACAADNEALAETPRQAAGSFVEGLVEPHPIDAAQHNALCGWVALCPAIYGFVDEHIYVEWKPVATWVDHESVARIPDELVKPFLSVVGKLAPDSYETKTHRSKKAKSLFCMRSLYSSG